MDKTPTRNMGPSRTLRLRFTPLINPNPGKWASRLPAVPMRVAKDGMCFPEMQDISRMLKKNNIASIALA
jgi:hypothetical protein